MMRVAHPAPAPATTERLGRSCILNCGKVGTKFAVKVGPDLTSNSRDKPKNNSQWISSSLSSVTLAFKKVFDLKKSIVIVMASSQGPTLAHRSVASIRSAPIQGQVGPSTPNTPPRAIASAYGSPSTIRSEEDPVVIELGSRVIRAGFAGDSLPKATIQCGQEQRRRVGDFRAWETPGRTPGHAWAIENEIWRYDLRSTDLGLVHDKLDRLLRETFTR
jgi:Actin